MYYKILIFVILSIIISLQLPFLHLNALIKLSLFSLTWSELVILEGFCVYCVDNKEYLNLYLILIVMNEIGSNFYRGSQSNTTKSKNNKASYDDLKFQHVSREKQLRKDE